jgi:hypothetical protein
LLDDFELTVSGPAAELSIVKKNERLKRRHFAARQFAIGYVHDPRWRGPIEHLDFCKK